MDQPYDFSEDEMSDGNIEEEEFEEPDFEQDDDRNLARNVFEDCYKNNYGDQWQKFQPQIQEFPSYNNVSEPLEQYNSPSHAFSAVISPGIINRIVHYTNIFIRRDVYSLKNKRLPISDDIHEVDDVEIRGIIGLWLSLGVNGFHSSSVAEIYSNTKASSLDAHLTFSRNRYRYIMKSIRFDDKNERAKNADKSWTDKFCHIREIFKAFTTNTKNKYSPGQYLTVDEILLSFRGRCSFRMYIPSKKAKFGIKLYCIIDPKTMYLLDCEVYLGREQTEQNHGANVVLREVKDLRYMKCKRIFHRSYYNSLLQLCP